MQKTFKFTEYLSKRKKQTNSKTDGNKRDQARPEEFQSQFKLFSNKNNELDMKPKAKTKRKVPCSLINHEGKKGNM